MTGTEGGQRTQPWVRRLRKRFVQSSWKLSRMIFFHLFAVKQMLLLVALALSAPSVIPVDARTASLKFGGRSMLTEVWNIVKIYGKLSFNVFYFQAQRQALNALVTGGVSSSPRESSPAVTTNLLLEEDEIIDEIVVEREQQQQQQEEEDSSIERLIIGGANEDVGDDELIEHMPDGQICMKKVRENAS